jgi:hypothetical protein
MHGGDTSDRRGRRIPQRSVANRRQDTGVSAWT